MPCKRYMCKCKCENEGVCQLVVWKHISDDTQEGTERAASPMVHCMCYLAIHYLFQVH